MDSAGHFGQSWGNRVLDIVLCRSCNRPSVTSDALVVGPDAATDAGNIALLHGEENILLNDERPLQNEIQSDARERFTGLEEKEGEGTSTLEGSSRIQRVVSNDLQQAPPREDPHNLTESSVNNTSMTRTEWLHSLRKKCDRIVNNSPLASAPSKQEASPKKSNVAELSHLTDTASSLVLFVLESVKEIGSNLPGIGAVGVVLSVLRKVKKESANRDGIQEALDYIEQLLSAVELTNDGLSDTFTSLSLDNGVLSEKLRAVSEALEQNKKRGKGVVGRGRGILSADADEEVLKAIWEGINRAQVRYQTEILTQMHRVMMTERDNAEEIKMDKLIDKCLSSRCADEASFDSYRSRKIVPCSPGTCVGVLETIKTWASDESDSQGHMFWLNGLAGIGKSTISMTIAGWAKREGILGASFFFARDSARLRDPSLVFPTIAVQLARHDSDFKRALYRVLDEDRAIGAKSIPNQFVSLIRRPLSACQKLGSVVIVVDALDECSSESDVKEILCLLLDANNLRLEGTKLRVFFSSRPEAHIRDMFHPNSEGQCAKVVLHDIADHVVRGDIQRYLRTEFNTLSRAFGLPENWAPEMDFYKLANDCGKFFEYAATAVRFIGDSRIRNPRVQLRKILEIRRGHQTASRPYSNLDRLYLGVLENAISDNFDDEDFHRIRSVIGTISFLQMPQSIDKLAIFLSMNADEIRNTLCHLHSVIIIPVKDSKVLRFFHPSFLEFITDKKRCIDARFFLDIPDQENFITRCCLKLILTGLHKITVEDYEAKGNIYVPSTNTTEECCLPWNKLGTWRGWASDNSTWQDSDDSDSMPGLLDVSDSDASSALSIDQPPPVRLSSVQEDFRIELAYACDHWSFHLSRAKPDNNNLLVNNLVEFVRDSTVFRNWFFVNQSMVQDKSAILAAHSWVLKHVTVVESSGSLLSALQDHRDEFEPEVILSQIKEKYRINTSFTNGERCTRGTLTTLLEHIRNWVEARKICATNRPRDCVFWLTGLIGSGKTCISRTIAHWAKLRGLVVCGGKVDNWGVERLIFTIAWTLADAHPRYKARFLESFNKNYAGMRFRFEDESSNTDSDSLHSVDSKTIFQDLVKDPLLVSADRDETESSALLLVLDFGWRHGSNQAKCIMQLLIDEMSSMPIPFLLLVSSRPDLSPREIMGSTEIVHPARVEDYVSTGDIREYLSEGLSFIHDDSTSAPDDWPNPADFESLASKCGTSFAYAASILRFIKGTGFSDPKRRLQNILANRIRISSLFKIHKLYHDVWPSLYRAQQQKGLLVLWVIAFLRIPLSVNNLSTFLRLSSDEIRATCEKMQSILVVPPGKHPYEHNSPLYFVHTSFRDFLAETYGSDLVEGCIAGLCFNLMRSLPLTFDAPLGRTLASAQAAQGGHQDHPSQNISCAMEYACVSWADHLENVAEGSKPEARIRDVDAEPILKPQQFFRAQRVIIGGGGGIQSELVEKISRIKVPGGKGPRSIEHRIRSILGRTLLEASGRGLDSDESSSDYDTDEFAEITGDDSVGRPTDLRRILKGEKYVIKKILLEELSVFVRRSLFSWLQALYQLGHVGTAATALQKVINLVETESLHCEDDVIETLRGAAQFVTAILNLDVPNTNMLEVFEAAWGAIPKNTLFYRTYNSRDEGTHLIS